MKDVYAHPAHFEMLSQIALAWVLLLGAGRLVLLMMQFSRCRRLSRSQFIGTVARNPTCPLKAISLTQSTTRSQARNSPSGVRLTRAKSRMRCATWSLTHTDQISLALGGRFVPFAATWPFRDGPQDAIGL